jgi:hypothetical protein
MVCYDGTVRNSLGDLIQFNYGEDSMDGAFIEKQSVETFGLTYNIGIRFNDILELTYLAKTTPIQVLYLPNWANLYRANFTNKRFLDILPRRSLSFRKSSLKTGLNFGKIARRVSFLSVLDYFQLLKVEAYHRSEFVVESSMQIDTQPLQISARV